MKIVSFKPIYGPNVYHHLPVMVMRVSLEEWTDKPSNEIPGFVDGLKTALPSLYDHTCSPGVPGGFFQRLERGTYMAHIIEHVALELSTMSGMDMTYGKSRYAGKPGLYDVIIRFDNEGGMVECLRSAFNLVEDVLHNTSVDVPYFLNNIKKACKRSALGPSADCLVKAAKKKKIPTKRIGSESLIQLGYGVKQRRVQSAITDRTSLIAADLVQDKEMTKSLLRQALIPVPHGVTIYDEEEIASAIEGLSAPYVLKPFDGHHGEGVHLNLQNVEELKQAYHNAKALSSRFIIEEMQQGRDYRVLVIDGKFAAAAERVPPFVIGDGQSSISLLIEKLNADPLRGEGHESYLSKVVVDPILIQHLAKQGLTLESIPGAEQKITLRGNANLSSGGTAIDVTNVASAEVRILCERIARLVGLDICGIDIISKDISKSVTESGLVIIEVNAGPGLRMHLLGKTEDEPHVGSMIVDMMYKNEEEARIPIISVTGTNGKTTVARLLHKIMSDSGKKCVGMTNTDGIWIGEKKICSGDCSGPLSADMVLSDQAVDCAVLELARGGLLRGGLAYDWSDVGIITNIRSDHIGQDGIETVDDILWIKSLVAERVRRGGTLVLNADDEHCMSLINNNRVKKHGCNIIVFSTKPDSPGFDEQLAMGRDACWLEDGHLVMSYKGRVQSLAYASDMPITLGGMAEFQISNILAALAAGIAMGVPAERILDSIQNFHPASENKGRLNLYRVGPGYAILDYGHNADAITNVGEMLRRWTNFKKTVVLGLPGDRSTEIVLSGARKAAEYFDKVILRDDADLRGRAPGELPRLITDLYNKDFQGLEHEICLKEEEAVSQGLSEIQEDEILVILYEDVSAVMKAMREYDPVSVLSLPQPEERPYQEDSHVAWQ
ncbi:cyanophycin synthetase [Bdellovibrio sp. HCB117]|uniref:cyanophycin synthetase n=1 Tax=Bdellovibrio sp. HCB117 TaxID=3394359 RepID=UPI0039B5FD93